MSQLPGHLAISASAGTGKTFQLAHRFIGLLMLGEPPERIIALTFSRKAAREIFDRIINYLAEASGSDEAAQNRNKCLGAKPGQYSPLDYQKALRRLLEKLPRSRVGTIDSFTVGVVRAFPYELGLEPDFEVFDNEGVEAQWCRRDALRLVLQGAATNADERKHFFESFKIATFGHEEKRSSQLLDDLMTSYQGIYRLQPDHAHWGLPVDTARPTCADTGEWINAIEHMRVLITAKSWPAQVHDYWMEFCDDLPGWSPEKEFTTRIKYMFERILPEIPKLGNEDVELKFGTKTFVLPKDIGCELKKILNFMGDETIRLFSIRTLGMFRLIDRCEKVYDEQIRRRGFLTFEDVLYALRYQKLGLSSAREQDRISIDYRLDGKLDHWLLDEFQDTSTIQWLVLSNLIDEVIQDQEKRRTFFYVGDVKQAIYGWRGGNAALFHQILRHYNTSNPPEIEQQPLDKSFRSCRPIISTVNRVFGKLPDRIAKVVRDEWQQIWHNQECADEKVPKVGYAALIELPKPDKSDEFSADESRFITVADMIAAIDPVAKGLTAAILCRGNKAAREMAELLRARHPNIPVVLEGQSHITDNPAVSLLLSLLQWAEHPGDLFAWRHVQMSPLSSQLPVSPGEILSALQEKGFRKTLATWSEKLESSVALTDFEKLRISQLLDMSAQHDREVSRSIDRFIELARQKTVEDSTSRNAVRIMTIHKSKGLDFDVVMLPDMQGGGGGDRGPMINWSEDRTVPEWILQYVRKQLVGLDARLQACVDREELRGSVEDLCVLYVAMTRAARALYLVTTEQPENSTADNHANIVNDTLGKSGSTHDELIIDGHAIQGTVIYQDGEPEWFKQVEKKESAATARADMPDKKLIFSITVEDRAVPSQGGEFEQDAGLVFATTMRESRELGSSVHAVFEKIEWLESSANIRELFSDSVSTEVVDHVTRCLKFPAVQQLLSRPAGTCEVWREQSFEIMLHGKWVSGVFDRVVLHRDKNGTVESAEIIDYKSNRIDHDGRVGELAVHYQSQMEIYRDVVSRLLNLPPDKISMTLLFTDAGRVVHIPPDK